MKKILSFICIFICLLSCTKTIDKKIVLTEYEETVKKIKKENVEYSGADFVKANQLLDKLALGSLSNGTLKTEKTYRQLLNEAKEENKKDSLEISQYNEEMEKMKSIISVKVMNSEYMDVYSPKLQSQYRTLILEMEFKNLSEKNITGIDGKILVKNNVGDIIKTSYIKLADSNLLPVGHTQVDTREYPVLEDYDNIMELKANDSKSFKYEWEPVLIIFDDSSRMKAPDKPSALIKDY